MNMQVDFLTHGSLVEVPGAKIIIPSLVREIRKAHRRNMPVIYILDCHKKNDPDFKLYPRHAVIDTPGQAIIDELSPRSDDILIEKNTYSAFYQSNLESRLRGLKVNHLVITGIPTETDILYTAVDAFMRGMRVSVPEDCVHGMNPDVHNYALIQLRDVLKPHVNT